MQLRVNRKGFDRKAFEQWSEEWASQHRDELLWAAGLFEGEGCISYHRNQPGYYVLRLLVSMNDRDVVDRFHRAVGGFGSIRGPLWANKATAPHWTWSVAGLAAKVILQWLLPQLGERRRARAEEVLRLIASNPEKKVRPSQCGYAGCNRPPVGRGLCKRHYLQWYRRAKVRGFTDAQYRNGPIKIAVLRTRRSRVGIWPSGQASLFEAV